MKKIFLLIFTIFCSGLLTFCQNNHHTDSNFEKFHRNFLDAKEYILLPKENIDILDTNIIKKINSLECLFEKKIDSNGFNGAVLISYKGTPIFERYYGYKNKYTQERLTPKSTFQIASTSKTFTSAAILLLYEEGRIDLNDTIERFFPNFPYKGITIKMLLSHRSGLPNYLNFAEIFWKDKTQFMTNKDVLNMLIYNRPKALALPDRTFYYNNTNYALLELIVEKASRMDFCDFMQENIFTPLAMYDTWLFDPNRKRTSEVKGYKGSNWAEDRIVYTDGVLGDKGIYASVRDLYKWDQALLSGKFLKPETLGKAYTPQSFEKAGSKNYGLGWRMQDQADGTRLIYHNGWWHSFNSVFNRKISDKTTIIILSNHFSNSVYKIQPIWDILYENQSVKIDLEE